MSITEELREYASNLAGMLGASVTDVKSALEDIADRIDQEHDGEFFDMQREHDEWVHDRDANYIPLPKDADGEPIHVGDVMDSRVDYLFDGKPFTVRALVLCEDGWEVADGRFGNRYEPDSLRHHHEPTVEDVLREFGRGWHERMNGPKTFDIADYVERYAAKLRLAGEDA